MPLEPGVRGVQSMINVFFRHALFVVAAISFFSSAAAQEESSVIAEGKIIGLEYTMSLADGTVVESNVGGEPYSYVHGDEQIIPGLEAALSGMAVDERKTVNLDAADAYGLVDPDAFREVPIENIAEEARTVGAELTAEGLTGTVRVHEVREETIVLDFNDPLAGKDLTFELHVVSIE
jgi:FKBP-type peptidyl-prolyl cis-trans isomerase 2